MINSIVPKAGHLTRIAALSAVICFSLLGPQLARANMITGDIAFVGTFTTTGGSGLQDATGIDFGTVLVAAGTGDFNFSNGVIPLLSPATMTDFTFAPLPSDGVDPLWTVGTFKFALNSLTTVAQSSTYLALAGTGVVTSTKTGLDATDFNWSLVGGPDLGGLKLFVSVSDPAPTTVNEPSQFSSLMLWTLGIGAVAVWSRKRRGTTV